MAKRPGGLTRRQVSRAARESRLQRSIWIGTAAVTVIIVGLIAFGFINKYVVQPNHAIVTVNGDSASVAEFQDRVKFDYYRQTGGMSVDELTQTYGIDASYFGQLTMNSMINELLIKQKAEEMGIEVSEDEIREETELAFGYDSSEPEPTATIIPTAEATAEPTITPTFVYTPTPSPTPTLAPGITPTVAPTATATPSEPPTATPTSLPLPTTEPMTESDYNEQVDTFITTTNQVTGLSENRIQEIIHNEILTSLLQQKVFEALDIQADETKVIVHAAHILVNTEEEAQAAIERINSGEAFEEVAADISQDTSNAYKGGDLGWFGPGDMVQPFETAAFELQEGELSEPIETSFGWHVIKLYERDNVALTASEQEQQKQEKFSELLSEWKSEATIEQEEDWQSYMPELP